MILVDTSVWVDHLRGRNSKLIALLEAEEVCSHPFVVGELACGNLDRRDEILSALQALPQVQAAEQEEVLKFIETRRLAGRGLGWVDVHLLASALLEQCGFWTLDKRLASAADGLALRHP